ncbi:uncharacterized protein LOC108665318 [Hyalella azteca]|uniref:Uncharacterized protein LOC108665318 n=1 Tax=Hyalella azteca TaxID=294128 RepID=A0A8B7N140_HYAAZ|nr:uncharacterized protein LOC108665318 [Hyalella azteca]
MDEIRNVIQKYLNLSDEVLSEVVKTIQDAGAENLSEAIEFIQEKDLAGVLKPIQIRKLLKRWSEQDCQPPVRVSTAATVSKAETVLRCPQVQENDLAWPFILDLKMESLDTEIIHDLDSQNRVIGRKRRALVRHVLSQIHTVTKRPQKKELRIIAARINSMYPKAITDHFDENKVGSGYDTFLNQLVNRNDNFYRKKLRVFGDCIYSAGSARTAQDLDCTANWQLSLAKLEQVAASSLRDTHKAHLQL